MIVELVKISNGQNFEFDLSNTDSFSLGRLSLELDSDKISRNACCLTRELMIHGYETFLEGQLEPTAPAILIKYQHKLTFTDTLTKGILGLLKILIASK